MIFGFRIEEVVDFRPVDGDISVGLGGDGASLGDYQQDKLDPWPCYSRHEVVRARQIVAVGVRQFDVYTKHGGECVNDVFLHFDADDLDDNVTLEPDNPLSRGIEPARLVGAYYVVHEDLTTEIVTADQFEAEYKLDG